MIVYIIQGVSVGILTILLVWYFSHSSTPYHVRFLVGISLLSSFLCFMLLPIDIYENYSQTGRSTILLIWRILYYVNVFLCWLVLPFVQEYEDSGQFTTMNKVKYSLRMNIILIGVILLGATCLLVYLLIIGRFSLGELPSIVATIINIFGLVLVSVTLGFGLISFPKECYLNSDYKKRANHCHRLAEMLRSQQNELMEEAIQIKTVLQKRSPSPEQLTVLRLLDDNFEFNGFRPYNDYNEKLEEKSNAQLHTMVKKQVLTYNACESQLDELVDELKSVTESFSSNNYSYKRILFFMMFGVVCLVGVLVFVAEVCSFIPVLSVINVLRVIQWDSPISYIMNCLLTFYIVYIVSHTVFRIKLYRVFALHKKHSTASSLCFTAINIARVAYPLCYNYLQITNMPNSYFITFFGDANIGSEYGFIFPVIMVVFAVFNLFDIYDKIMGYLGFSSYAFDEEEAQEKTEEGQKILVEKLRERSIENSKMQMIELL